MPPTVAQQIAAHQGMVVLRDINSETSQFWLVPMSGGQFEQWWLAQKTLDLPESELTPEAIEIEQELRVIFGEQDYEPPKYRTEPFPGIFLSAEAEDEIALWLEMCSQKAHYFCNLCCNADSYLRTPDGRTLWHAGSTKNVWPQFP